MDAVRADSEALQAYLESRKDSAVELQEFITALKRRKYGSSYSLAKSTLELLRSIVGRKRWTDAGVLMKVLRGVGRRLIKAYPMELVVGNIVRRVLFQIREEYNHRLKDDSSQISLQKSSSVSSIGEQPALYSMLNNSNANNQGSNQDFSSVRFQDLRSTVIDGINELVAEIENIYDPIARQALEHIHANEMVLVFGYSQSVLEFLISAQRKRRFQVIVAEAAPDYRGHDMALKLSKANIPTTVIIDSAIFGIMARVNKVIVGTHAVMANGALIAEAGTNIVALAAKHHSVPVVCVTGLYKLCPLYPHNQDSFNDLKSSGSVLDYSDMPRGTNIQVVSPAYDVVPSELINLFVTNSGGHQPSYIYRLLAEHYNPEDSLTEECSLFS